MSPVTILADEQRKTIYKRVEEVKVNGHDFTIELLIIRCFNKYFINKHSLIIQKIRNSLGIMIIW